jgi:hypothetical protein
VPKTRNHWALEIRSSSSILKTRKRKVSETPHTVGVSRLSPEDRQIQAPKPCFLLLLYRTMNKVQKRNESQHVCLPFQPTFLIFKKEENL